MKRLFAVLALLCSVWVGNGSASELTAQIHPLERNGVALFLHSLSADSFPSPKNILLVHGVAFSSHEFDVDYADYSLTRWLARQGYTVWTLDIAGFGRSGAVSDGFIPDSDYAAEDIAAAADAILAKSGQQRLDVFGWSWGTVTASRFSAKHPGKVRSLILYAPILAGLGAREVKSPFVTAEAYRDAYKDFRLLPDDSVDPAITDLAVIERYTANAKRCDNHPIPNGGRRDLLVSRDARLIPVRDLTMPTLLILGDLDAYVDAALATSAAGEIPGKTRLEIIVGGSHVLFLEKAHYRQFRNIVLDFLQNDH
ncbi:MAG: alpha/beta hydrolase [Candidatus Accumulibacter sp.]|jgi:pimeloyl-ACP methyl ester carboxylesterase|nr:alpha/beta hydrolase [Accumulibacter sp.]